MTTMDFLTITSVVSIVLGAILTIDPRAKLWLSDALERFARWACCDLRARAEAQRAARNAWQRVYRHAKSLPMGESVWIDQQGIDRSRGSVA